MSQLKFENSLYLSLITEENKPDYIYIKDLNRCMCNKTKNKSKKHFCKHCLQCFSSEKSLQEHKETCLKISGKQRVKLRSGLIQFKNYFKQVNVSFDICADFEALLKGVPSNDRNDNTSYTKKYQKHIPCSFV